MAGPLFANNLCAVRYEGASAELDDSPDPMGTVDSTDRERPLGSPREIRALAVAGADKLRGVETWAH